MEELASRVDYDLQKDEFNIKNELDSNIEKYYDDITKILQNDNEEQLRYYKYDLHYRHNVQSSPKYLKQILNDISYYNDKFDIQKYLGPINSIESSKVISGIDSIISNLKLKKRGYSQVSNSSQNQVNNSPQNNQNNEIDSKSKLKKLHAELLQEWKESIESNLHSWKKNQVKKTQNATIKRVKGYLKAMKEAKETMEDTKEISEMFEDMIMEQLREGLKSGQDIKSYMSGEIESNDEISQDSIKEILFEVPEMTQEERDGYYFETLPYRLYNEYLMTKNQREALSENNENTESKAQNTQISIPNQMQNIPHLGYSTRIKRPKKSLHKRLVNFNEFIRILQKDSIKELCDMLGRLDDADNFVEMSKVDTQDYNTKMPTKYANDELSGLHFASQISNILPQELMLINDKDFNILFDMKYAENRLLSFEKEGFESVIEKKEMLTKDKQKGPIILCIDTSSSMFSRINGVKPAVVAKAVTLFLTKRARQQGRDCLLINFSETFSTLDLSGKNGTLGLLDFLSSDFNGGTDSIPAFKYALKKCQNENYKAADILMISDFIFAPHIMKHLKEIMKNKDKQIKCNALYVGNLSPDNLKGAPFDNNFIYNPKTRNIESLVGATRKILG